MIFVEDDEIVHDLSPRVRDGTERAHDWSRAVDEGHVSLRADADTPWEQPGLVLDRVLQDESAFFISIELHRAEGGKEEHEEVAACQSNQDANVLRGRAVAQVQEDIFIGAEVGEALIIDNRAQRVGPHRAEPVGKHLKSAAPQRCARVSTTKSQQSVPLHASSLQEQSELSAAETVESHDERGSPRVPENSWANRAKLNKRASVKLRDQWQTHKSEHQLARLESLNQRMKSQRERVLGSSRAHEARERHGHEDHYNMM